MYQRSLNRSNAMGNQVRRLTQVLFVSGAINILLFLAFLSLLYLESPLLPFPSHSKTNKEVVYKPPLPDLAVLEPKKQVRVVKEVIAPVQLPPLIPKESVTKGVEVVKVPKTPVSTSSRLPCATYVVLDGDSLWKIARKFGVDVATLKQINHLENDRLRQGMVLSIPTKNSVLTSARS